MTGLERFIDVMKTTNYTKGGWSLEASNLLQNLLDRAENILAEEEAGKARRQNEKITD